MEAAQSLIDTSAERSVAEVGEDNAAWIKERKKEVFDRDREAAALTNMMAGSSRTHVEQACGKVGQSARLEAATVTWTTLAVLSGGLQQ